MSISKQEKSGDQANKIFKELDVDGNGEIDENEFVKGCMEDLDLIKHLNNGGLEPRRGSVDAFIEG